MNERDSAIVEMARLGHPSYRIIGEHFGVSPSRVGQILTLYGAANPASGAKGPSHPRWNGGRTKTSDGYVAVHMPNHPRATKTTGYVREHILIVQEALGGPLPEGAVVHHVNEVRDDNANHNLVACQDNAYHGLLHKRMRARRACGDPNWLKCRFCGEWNDPGEFYVHPKGSFAHHRRCKRDYQRKCRHDEAVQEVHRHILERDAEKGET